MAEEHHTYLIVAPNANKTEAMKAFQRQISGKGAEAGKLPEEDPVIED